MNIVENICINEITISYINFLFLDFTEFNRRLLSTPSLFPDATNALVDKILTQSWDAVRSSCACSKYKLKTELYNYT